MRRIIIVVLLGLWGCNDQNVEKHKEVPLVTRYRKGKFIIEETRNNINRKLVKVKSFDHTGSKAKGVDIDFYENGEIQKWLWFDSSTRFPCAGVYYNNNGKFDSFKGYPMIHYFKESSGKILVETINPPGVPYILGFREFVNGNRIKQSAYNPIVTDTTSWFVINNVLFEKKHHYFFYFYFLDTNGGRKKILDSSMRELEW